MSESDDEWPEVRAWRKATRQRLVAARTAVDAAARAHLLAQLDAVLDAQLTRAAPGRRTEIAFYWPIRGEPALFPTLRRALARGAGAALPFIPAPDRALEFRRWAPGTRVVRGIWDIPTPARDERVVPDVLLIPVVGFDALGHRLGNGGGFYDRTLAALPAATLRIGVGFECLRLPSIRPQPHDLPMDVIVTEGGSFAVPRER